MRKSTGYPGLGPFTVAALTPPDVNVRVVDESVEDVDPDWIPDLVGITTLTHTAPHVYRVSQQYRDRGIPVVLGGVHVTMNPDEAEQHASSIVVGEAELSWPRLIDDFRRGELKPRYEPGLLADLDASPPANREHMRFRDYQIPNVMLTSKGCPFDCEFCTLVAVVDYKMRFRSVESVIEEIRNLPPGPLLFVDDNLYANKEYARELFRQLAPLKRKWTGEATWHITFDDETLTLAKKSGCLGLFVGFDAIGPQHMMRKVAQDPQKTYVEAVRNMQRKGMAIVAAFVFGFDNDDPGVFSRTWEIIRQSQADLVNFSVLVPYPGTPMFERFEREGRIIERDWSKYVTPNVVYQPKNMTPEQLREGTQWIHNRFFSLGNVAKAAVRTTLRSGWGLGLLALKLNLARGRNISFLESAAHSPGSA
ncbi:MAG: radical SAM protein [Planctomycetota bacterium]